MYFGLAELGLGLETKIERSKDYDTCGGLLVMWILNTFYPRNMAMARPNDTAVYCPIFV
jgi:hypothetical protein